MPRAVALAIFLAAACLAPPQPAVASDAPVFHCPPAAASNAPALGASPTIKVFVAQQLGPGWQPPPCTGWTAAPVRLVVALTGRFQGPSTTDELLARAGAVSDLKTVKYWSTHGKRWKAMLSTAQPLAAPDAKQRRGGFSLAEMRTDQPLYALLDESGMASSAIFRMRTARATATDVAFELENVTAVSMIGVTLFNPGDIKSFAAIARQADGSWLYQSLIRIDDKANSLLQGGDGASYVNRAVALYRHLAGQQTDAEPPAMR